MMMSWESTLTVRDRPSPFKRAGRGVPSRTGFLQLSNYRILEDRHTGTIELYMTRLGAFLPDDPWRSRAYRYRIEVPAE